MKIREIIVEYDSPEAQLSGQNLSTNLVNVLMFLKKRHEDNGVVPKLRTDSVIRMVQNTGDNTFTYDALVSAYEQNDAVKNLIKSYNEQEIILATDDAEGEETGGEVEANAAMQSPEDTVDSMAKKALNKRT